MKTAEGGMKTAAFFLIAASALAQAPSPFQVQPSPAKQPTDAEQQELMKAVTESANSPLDLLRSLEAYLQKHPDTVQRADIELTIAKAAMEVKDDRRVVEYGERVLAKTKDDVLMLDRVSQSLLTLGGAENAQKAIDRWRSLLRQDPSNRLR